MVLAARSSRWIVATPATRADSVAVAGEQRERALVGDRARDALRPPGPAQARLDQVARHRRDPGGVGGPSGSQGDVFCVHAGKIECNEHAKISTTLQVPEVPDEPLE